MLINRADFFNGATPGSGIETVGNCTIISTAAQTKDLLIVTNANGELLMKVNTIAVTVTTTKPLKLNANLTLDIIMITADKNVESTVPSVFVSRTTDLENNFHVHTADLTQWRNGNTIQTKMRMDISIILVAYGDFRC